MRALATIAVIILHVSAPILYKYGSISYYTWNIGNLFDGMVRWCVPVFFMLSGSLLLNEDIEISSFLKKRFLRILPPFIFWSFIYIIFDQFIFNSEPVGILEYIKITGMKLFNGSKYHLWFVYTLLGLYLVIPILRKFVRKSSNKEVLYFIVIWFFAVISNHPRLKAYLPKINLDFFTGFIGYFILGYFLSKNHFENKIIPILLFVFGSMITIFGTVYLFNMNNRFSGYFYDYLSPNVIISSVGFFLITKNIRIKSSIMRRFFAEISSHSYGIYLVHVLILTIMSLIGIDWQLMNPIISIPLTTSICLTISFAIINFLRRIKYCKYISG